MFDEQRSARRARLPRVPPALPAAGLGRARRRGDLGRHARRGERGARRGGRRAAASSPAIGITNQRETVVAWDRDTGEPLHRAIVWQDRRTAAPLRRAARGRPRAARARAHRAGARPLLLRHEDRVAAQARAACRATRPSARSTPGSSSSSRGEHATDYSNASRTLLFDIRERALGRRAVRPARRGPAARCPSRARARTCSARPSEFGGSVPVAGIAGDQQAALYGQACYEPGLGKNTYGTGSFVLQNAGGRAARARRGAAHHGRVGRGRPRGLRARGRDLRDRRRGAVAARRARDHPDARTRPRSWPRSLDSNDGVYFVPAFTGLGSPHWDPYARGTIVGLTRGAGRAHLARAALEAMAYQTVDAVRAMEDGLGRACSRSCKADGGAVVNGWLMQFQADVLGVPVVVPEIVRDDRARRRLPGRGGHRDLDRGGRARDVARGRALRAVDVRGRARDAARRAGRAALERARE